MTPQTEERSGFGLPRGLTAPRILRRPLRLLNRFLSGRVAIPRYLGVASTAVFFAVTGAYGSVVGGHIPAIIQSVTAASGFAVNDILIAGHSETSEIDVLGELGLDGSTSLIGFDTQAARKRIVDLPWVRNASVRKIYPDTIRIEIEERKPFAIWQQGHQLSLVDRYGEPIVPFTDGKFAGLPLVVGYGAAEKAERFISEVYRFPAIAGGIKGYIRVADRRWDLMLSSGVTLRLPEKNEMAALERVLKLDSEHGLLSRDVSVVDLRSSDKLILKLSPDAATSRKAAIEKQMKSGGKGKRI